MTLSLSKLIEIEDFGKPELRRYLAEINEQESIRFGTSPDDIVEDSKQWECAMALRALDHGGCAQRGRIIAGIGAGTEATIFALARRGAIVFPVDRYLQRTVWSDVSPAGMLVEPARYCALEIPRGHVIPVHSSALELNLPSATFDAVFSSGSIEHFGSLEAVAEASREIGRILKPGGVACIATEFRIDGPNDLPWFDDNVILFTPDLLRRYIVEPSGLTLREPLDISQSEKTFESRTNLVDFLQRANTIHGIEEKRAVYPNLILYHDGFLFCSVAITLHKDRSLREEPTSKERAEMHDFLAQERSALIVALERFQRTSDDGRSGHEANVLASEIQGLRNELAALRSEYERSNAWKRWRVMRPARYVYRRFKGRRG